MSPDETKNSDKDENNKTDEKVDSASPQSSTQVQSESPQPQEDKTEKNEPEGGTESEPDLDATPSDTEPEVAEDTSVKEIPKKKLESEKAVKDEKGRRFDKASEDEDFWVPKTRLGKLVKSGEVTTMKDALATGLRIREPEIIDILLPELDDEVLDVNMVQRMTDSGRRVRFAIMTVVGNQNGYVGLGSAKGKEVGPAIRKAIDNAKLNIIEIRRGCGSWECGCAGSHTIPFTVTGKSGSTKAIFRPAPRGVGLAVGDVAKHILRLSGIKDAWGFTRGETRTTINYAKAVFKALQNTAKLKTTQGQITNLHIISGAIAEEIDTESSTGSEGSEHAVAEEQTSTNQTKD